MHESGTLNIGAVVGGILALIGAGIQFWKFSTSWWTFVAPGLWIFTAFYAMTKYQEEVRAYNMLRSTIGLAAINIIVWIVQTILNFVAPQYTTTDTWARIIPPILGFIGSVIALVCAAMARRHFPAIYGSVVVTAPQIVTQPAVVQTTTTTTTTNAYVAQPAYVNTQPGYAQPYVQPQEPQYAQGYVQPQQPQYAQPYMAQPGYAQPQPAYAQPVVYSQPQPYPN